MDESKKVNFSDSVFMGDVNYISNNYQNSDRVTCPQCQASGNLTTFVCKGTNLNNFTCDNRYCEHCEIDTFPNICHKCINEIEEHKRQEQYRRVAERNARIAKEEEDRLAALERVRIIDEQNRKAGRFNTELIERERRLAEEVHAKQEDKKFSKAKIFFVIYVIIMVYFLDSV